MINHEPILNPAGLIYLPAGDNDSIRCIETNVRG